MREGIGSESAPYFSADGTAGIQEELRQKAERGGTVRLECARYDITSTVQIDTPCICLEGDARAFYLD